MKVMTGIVWVLGCLLIPQIPLIVLVFKFGSLEERYNELQQSLFGS